MRVRVCLVWFLMLTEHSASTGMSWRSARSFVLDFFCRISEFFAFWSRSNCSSSIMFASDPVSLFNFCYHIIDHYRTRFRNFLGIQSSCLSDSKVLDEVFVVRAVTRTDTRALSVLSTCRIFGFLCSGL